MPPSGLATSGVPRGARGTAAARRPELWASWEVPAPGLQAALVGMWFTYTVSIIEGAGLLEAFVLGPTGSPLSPPPPDSPLEVSRENILAAPACRVSATDEMQRAGLLIVLAAGPR